MGVTKSIGEWVQGHHRRINECVASINAIVTSINKLNENTANDRAKIGRFETEVRGMFDEYRPYSYSNAKGLIPRVTAVETRAEEDLVRIRRLELAVLRLAEICIESAKQTSYQQRDRHAELVEFHTVLTSEIAGPKPEAAE